MVYFKVAAAALFAATAVLPVYALPFNADDSLSTRDAEELNAIYARMSEVSDELKARDLYGELNQNDARDIEDFLERRSLPDFDDELVARDFNDGLNLEARDYDKLLERYFDDLKERTDSSSYNSYHGDADPSLQHKKPFKKRNFFENIGGWFRKVFHMQTKEDKAYEAALKEHKREKKAAKKVHEAAKKVEEKVVKVEKKVVKKVEHEKSLLTSEEPQQQHQFSSSPSESSYGSVVHHHEHHAYGSQSSPAPGQDLYTGSSGAHGAESYPPSPLAEASNLSPAGSYGGYQARELEDLEERDDFDLEERDDFDLEERDDLELEERDDLELEERDDLELEERDDFELEERDDFDDLD
jgi:hypothetical protein